MTQKTTKATVQRSSAKSTQKQSSKTNSQPNQKTAQKTAQKTTQKSATSTSKKVASRSSQSESTLELPSAIWMNALRRAKGAEARSGKRAFLYVFGANDTKLLKKTLAPQLAKWQLEMLLQSETEIISLQGKEGPLWVVRLASGFKGTSTGLEKSSFARARDLAGGMVTALRSLPVDKFIIEMHGLMLDEERAVIVGLEMAAYSFNESQGRQTGKRALPQPLLRLASDVFGSREIDQAAQLATSINIARHLVNLPGGTLDPRTYAEAISELFAESSTVTVDVWAGDKLEQERMNLLLAVGRGAEEGPRMVHLRYRPKAQIQAAGERNALHPVAIVGKGITFDSGGLDIKPSSGMRLMKKDMGGSAAAIGIAKWAEATNLPLGLDVYVALAENAVSSKSFRPGDVIVARSGQAVEIHNTDAEGRLVLADALDVAASQEGEDKPMMIIDLATLTGAIKVGLGAEIAGLFANDDDVATRLFEAGLDRGDFMWRMPLFQPYRSMLRSTFADTSNCSEGGFGGAVTAALFLESYVKGIPWAHLDIYAWKDAASGAWSEGGGSGQPVQAVTLMLERLASELPGEELA